MTRKRKPVVTAGSAQVALWLGVSRAAVANWLARYPDQVPAPDVVIAFPSGHEDWGWKPQRRAEWEAFYATRHRRLPQVWEPKRKYAAERDA